MPEQRRRSLWPSFQSEWSLHTLTLRRPLHIYNLTKDFDSGNARTRLHSRGSFKKLEAQTVTVMGRLLNEDAYRRIQMVIYDLGQLGFIWVT